MDCVFLEGLIINIAKYRIKDEEGYIMIESENQLEEVKKHLDEIGAIYTVEELDYKPHEWAKGIAIEDGNNLLEKARATVAEGEVTYYAKKELKELDVIINRATEDIYAKTETDYYASTKEVVDRKNELREIIQQEKQKRVIAE